MKQERSDLLPCQVKERFAIADSIRVPIEIAGCREHGHMQHNYAHFIMIYRGFLNPASHGLNSGTTPDVSCSPV